MSMNKDKKEKTNNTNHIYRKKDRGSILILTMMAVLILSILVSGLLTVGTTEMYTTQNFQLSKSAYYSAVQGVEEVRNLIYNFPDAQSIKSIKRYTIGLEGPLLSGDNPAYGTNDPEGAMERSYITGNLKEMEQYDLGNYAYNPSVLRPIDQLEGFKAPPLPAISMGGTSSIAPVVWKVTVTAKVKVGTRYAYSEISSGVYSVLTIAY
jgi:hypothetical protein